MDEPIGSFSPVQGDILIHFQTFGVHVDPDVDTAFMFTFTGYEWGVQWRFSL